MSDHYNKYGFLYARTIFNKKGQLVSRSYYDGSGNEKVVENFVTHDIILNQEDKVYIFKNKVEFAKHLFTELDDISNQDYSTTPYKSILCIGKLRRS